MRSAGCAVNDWADRRFDAHVERTAGRPLAAGEIAAVGGARGRRGARVLRVPARARHQPDDDPAVVPGGRRSPSSIRSSSASSCCRRRSSASRSRSAFRWRTRPSTTRCRRSRGGCSLLNLFWVVAYDTEYAMVDRDDDLRLGLRTSAIAFGRFDVARGDALLRGLPRRHGGGRDAAARWGRSITPGSPWRSAARLFHWTLIRRRDRDALLPGVPAQSLARPRGVRRRRARLRRAPRGVAARAVTMASARARRADPAATCRTLRAAAGARARRARADPRQLSGRGLARRRAVLRASAQSFLAAAGGGDRRAARRRCPTARRLAALRANGIGLWDAIVACRRRGSLDGAIRDAERGEVARVRRAAPALALVCFNGQTAARALPAWRDAGYATLALPSSSPAYTRPFAEKLAAWRAIGAFLRDARRRGDDDRDARRWCGASRARGAARGRVRAAARRAATHRPPSA